MKSTTRSNGAGFTLVELIVIVGIISVVMVGATTVMPSMLKQSRADASTAIVVNTMRLARDRAIGERRNMDLIFTAPNKIQVSREEIDLTLPVGYTPVKTVVMTVYLENSQKFLYFTATGDTGDTFGVGNAPLAFPTPNVMFTSEGTLVNSAGDPINGTIFLATSGDVSSARAVTIFGVTAMVRSWRWSGSKWAE